MKRGVLALTVAPPKIDANTFEMLSKIDGKEIQSRRSVISKDGKTMIRTINGKNTQGQDINSILVFDKQ